MNADTSMSSADACAERPIAVAPWEDEFVVRKKVAEEVTTVTLAMHLVHDKVTANFVARARIRIAVGLGLTQPCITAHTAHGNTESGD